MKFRYAGASSSMLGGQAFVPWASIVYSGEDIPEDSILFYESGLVSFKYSEGIHTGADSSADLIDSSKSGLWTIDEWIGYEVRKSFVGESGSVTDSDGTAVVATLSGGEVWNNGDVYLLVHPTKLIDTSKTWTPDEFVGFRLLNLADATNNGGHRNISWSSGLITTNGINTCEVDSLTGGENNVFAIGDDYKIVMDIDAGDTIGYQTKTLQGGTVTMSAEGVPSVSGVDGSHTFHARITDVSVPETSAQFTVTIEVG